MGGEKRARRETEQRKYEHVATRRKHSPALFTKGVPKVRSTCCPGVKRTE